MESAHSVQVVSVKDDHTYQLNEEELKKILTRDDIKDLPVALVSVAGAYRGGKSFLLNFFIRYLSASASARSDGSWLGDDSTELTGFVWQGGSVRVTTGILMWSEPFVVTLPSGEKVAVLLMDTQGTFDSSSSVKDSSTIFALSSLLSSIQIYNIKSNITEEDLQNLELFIDYGKMVKEDTEKEFQVLMFLIRDWMNPWEYAFGLQGGTAYIDKKFKTYPNQPQELREIRQHTLASFEKVTCFLMPHPGLGVANPKFKGKINEISQDFTHKLKELTTFIFGPENVCRKKIDGQFIKSGELLNYFKSYLPIFNSGKIPTPVNISEATANAGLLMAANQVREKFEEEMNRACGSEAPSMPASGVIKLHQQEMEKARIAFTEKKLFGDKELIDQKLEELMQDLNEKQKDFIEINRLKTLKAITNGNEAYDKAIETVTKGQPLCVNAFDLLQLHNDAVAAALNSFSENRKTENDGLDSDKDLYSQNLSAKYEELEHTNDHNNKIMIVELKSDYFEYMMSQVKVSKPCADSLNEKHNIALSKALDGFEARRNLPNSHKEDIYKTDMMQAIQLQNIQVMQISEHANDAALTLALQNFNRNSIQPTNLRHSCEIPERLRREHEEAVMQAFVIVPSEVCYKTRKTLQEIMDNHYSDITAVNEASNERAVSAAYWTYENKFNTLCDHWYYAFQSWTTIRKYHEQALENAKQDFYNRRRSGRTYGVYDYYLNKLVEKCEDYYRNR